MGQLADVQPNMIRAARAAPYLERDDEKSLAKRWRDNRDDQALHKLAHAHMRLVMAIASRFRFYGLPVADLIQEGHVGLLEAAARFEPDREVRFSTYATWWIRASIQDYVLRNWSIVRGGTSSNQKALFFNLRRLRARLSRHGDVSASVAFGQIALALGVSRSDVEMMNARLSGPDVSLNAPLTESDSTGDDERMDFLIDDKPLPDEAVGGEMDANRRVSWLREAMNVLNERELKIVRERKLSDDGATLESLAAKLGVSKERVRQLESRAMDKLRKALLDRHPDEFAALQA